MRSPLELRLSVGGRSPAGVNVDGNLDHIVDRGAKRTLDLAVALSALVALAPLLAVLWVLVRLSSPGPALFRQVRVGRHGRPFVLFKFRTMRVGVDDNDNDNDNGNGNGGARDDAADGDAADENAADEDAADEDEAARRAMIVRELITDEPAGTADGVYKLDHDRRVTPLGVWLRRMSLDELPQLANVVRGDMSLVGPRPCLPWEVALFDEHHSIREAVRPGLTGLWQVSGRNCLSMGEMLVLDGHYVRSRSLWLDLRILARTPGAVLRGIGAR